MPQESPETVSSPKRSKRWLGLAVLAAVAAAIGATVHMGGRMLGPVVVRQLEAYTGMNISVDSAWLSPGGRLWLHNLAVTMDEEGSLLVFQAGRVTARFRILSMLRGSPELKKLTVTGGLLNAEYDPGTGRWNLAHLAGRSEQGATRLERLPELSIHDSTLRVTRRDGASAMTILEIPFGLNSRKVRGGGHEFLLSSTPPAHAAQADARNWFIEISGTTAGTGRFGIEASLTNIILSNEPAPGELRVGRAIAEALHGDLVKLWDKYSPGGTVDMDISVSGGLGDLRGSRLAMSVMFKDSTLSYHRFPYALEGVHGNIVFSDGELSIKELAGKRGETKVTISGYSRGSGAAHESDVRIRSDMVVIDEDIYKALTPGQQQVWRMFSPAGTTELDFHHVSRAGTVLLSRTTLRLIEAEMMYEHFPHQFRGGTGTMIFEPNSVRIENVSFREGDSVTRFDGEVTDILSGRPEVRINGLAEGLPIEARRLSGHARTEYRQQLDDLDFSGRMDMNLQVFSTHSPEWSLSYIADVNVKTPELRSRSRNISLKDVHAQVSVTPTSVSIADLDGRYDDGRVSVQGQFELAGDAGVPVCYRLTINGADVSVDERILALLPQAHRSFLEGIQPSGKINLSANLSRSNGVGEANISVECLGNAIELSGTGYRLSNITGRASMAGNLLEFDGLRAIVLDPEGGEPGSASLAGMIKVGTDGIEEMDISFDVQTLRFGKGIRSIVDRLAPRLYDTIAPSGNL
ncbi:MAG TPA: hypothetical protein VLH60_00420, partial [Sedimentisphaerales bacterium]|nr:hypothetical protein [Sedimentisphaerales bacterium]